MYASTKKLLHAADVIEKCAAYFENEEIVETEKRASELKSNFLDPIKDSVMDMNPALSEKLAHADPDVLSLIKDLTASKEIISTDDGSMGGSSEKIASEDQDDSLLAFCMDD